MILPVHGNDECFIWGLPERWRARITLLHTPPEALNHDTLHMMNAVLRHLWQTKPQQSANLVDMLSRAYITQC